MKTKIVLFMLFFVVTSNAFARNGIYFLAEGGYSQYRNLPSAAEANALSASSSNFPAIRGTVGYNHDWSPYFGLGLELAMGRYGNQTYRFPTNRLSLRAQTLEFLIAGQTHLQQWDILAKIGGIRQTIVYSNQPNQTTICPIAGLGFAYNFNCHIALTSEYIHIFGYYDSKNIINNPIKNISTNALLAGIRYTF